MPLPLPVNYQWGKTKEKNKRGETGFLSLPAGGEECGGWVAVDQRGSVGKLYFRLFAGSVCFPIEILEADHLYLDFVDVLWKTPFLLYGLSNVAKKFDRY